MMACPLNTSGFSVSGHILNYRAKESPRLCSSIGTSRKFLGKPLIDASDHTSNWNVEFPAQESGCNATRWWEKTLKPNMIEIKSAAQLVLKAGDNLVVIDLYSPTCKTLHPKMCQLAESNPNAIFLKVNYEQLKTMCNALHIPVLPFFRFYKGAQGKVCSFSCTNATIKKFKDALGRYGNRQCSFGPAKGLDESELLALASTEDCTREDIFQEGVIA